VTGAAHLPPGIGAASARSLLRLEGFATSLAYRTKALAALLRPFGAVGELGPQESEALWRQVRDATFLAEPRDHAVWRISVAPGKGPALVEAVSRGREARWFYDWGGGLVWLGVAATGDADAALIQAQARAAGGHAVLVRAPDAVRAAIDVFQPQPDELMRLTRAVKASFDPAGVLEPGRLYSGV
jgi:glycolate oxidase FAD binding subunit